MSPSTLKVSLTQPASNTEQETLIATLAQQNTHRNAAFHRLLYALPALSTIPFLLALFLPQHSRPSAGTTTTPPSPSPSHLLSLLGLSSLLATALTLHRLGVTETGFAFLDHQQQQQHHHHHHHHYRHTATAAMTQPRRRRAAGSSSAGLLGSAADYPGAKSPLARHLPWLNVALAALALLTGLLEERARTGQAVGGGGGNGSGGGGGSSAGVSPGLLGALPGVVYAVVVGAKVVMAGVDPERELGGLKYGYKGA
jgi:hypothetical protein